MSTLFSEFLALSAKLTAFSEFDLMGTGQANLYFDTVTGVAGDSVLAELVEAFGRARAAAGADNSAWEAALRREVLSHPKLGPVARNIIKMWFSGTWYQLPAEWRLAYGARDKDFTFVVSPVSYTEGLLWPTIGANPSGAKAPGYGTWEAPPRIPKI